MKRRELQHPLISKVQLFVKKKRLLQPEQKLIVTVSGGIDSVVMLDALMQLQAMWKFEIVVAHVNFKLRGKESDGDEQFVRRLAERYDLPFYSEQANTRKIAKQQQRSLQETARDIRYTFFDTLKKSLKADAIVTAHNANDNAETMLLNLLRGSGIDGVAGIPVQRDNIIRPLLCVTRKEIVQYAKKKKLKFREDSSNSKDEYTRNYLRNNIIPKLEQRINPSLNETLLNEAEVFRSAANFANKETDNVYSNVVSSSKIDIKKLSALDPFIQQSVVRRVMKELRIEPSFIIISSILELAEHQKGTIVEINKTWIAERLSNEILIRGKSIDQTFLYVIEKAGTLTTDDFVFSVKKSALPDNKNGNDSSNEYVDAAKVKFPLTVRSWQKGDSFIPLGMKGKKKLSDFFGEKKLSSEEKKMIPIVESNREILWVAGKRLDERYKLTDSTTDVYQLSITFNGKKNDYR